MAGSSLPRFLPLLFLGVYLLFCPAPAHALDGGTDAATAALVGRLASPDETARSTAALELIRVGDTESLRAVIRVAPEESPALRREISDGLANLGERATPALILEWKTSPTPPVRRFAGALLESMERHMPGEAIQTKSQEILAEVLRAYGTAKDPDALGVVLSFTNADREIPREAARKALFDYGPVANGKIREAYANFHNRPAPEDWSIDRVARELFAAYDRDRRKEMYTLLEDALGVLKRAQETTPPDTAQLAKAVDSFDRILARAPEMERRAEMVPAYVLLAKSVEATDPERATKLYRKGAQLDPSSPRMPQIEGALLALEGKALRARGIDDEELLNRAIALDPANSIARAELDQIEKKRGAHEGRLVRIMWIGAVVAAAGLLILVGFALRRRLRT
jgi:hypothetical protein